MSTHVGDTIRTRIEMSLAYSKKIELSKKVKLKLPLRELVNRFPVNVPYPKRRNAPITEAVENSKIAEQCKISKVIMLQPVQIERIARIDPDEAVRRLMLWE